MAKTAAEKQKNYRARVKAHKVLKTMVSGNAHGNEKATVTRQSNAQSVTLTTESVTTIKSGIDRRDGKWHRWLTPVEKGELIRAYIDLGEIETARELAHV